MRDFRTFWRAKAADQSILKEDVFRLCIFRALRSREEDKLKEALRLLQMAFTAVTNETKINNGYGPYKAVEIASLCGWKRVTAPLIGVGPITVGPHIEVAQNDNVEQWEQVFESEGEVAEYNKLANAAVRHLVPIKDGYYAQYEDPYYIYIIVRKDLPTPEDTTVQVAHAIAKMGWLVGRYYLTEGLPEGVNPFDHINFVVCQTKNWESLAGDGEYIYSLGYDSVSFREPDLDNQMTAIAVEPILGSKRRVMKRYKLLKHDIKVISAVEGNVVSP